MLRNIYYNVFIILTITFLASSVIADVPDNHTSLQEAIDAALDGDIINVAPGIYTGKNNKNLDFYGKNIQLICTSESAQCTIDCENSGRGFYFHSNENETVLISGFTIMGGNVSKAGGGILCVSSSPTITNCVITHNTASWDYGGNGGGIACINASPKIYNTEISNNTANYNGSGLYCKGDSCPVLDGCHISNNTQVMYGGGISAHENANLTILNSVISNNAAQFSGGGLSCTSSPTIRNSILNNNRAQKGGGIASFFAAPTIKNCIISNNAAENGGGIAAMAFSSISITSCSIRNNVASSKGSGISIYPSATPQIMFCTIWGTDEKDAIEIDLSEERLSDTQTGIAIVSNSSIQGGYTGIQNTSLDDVNINGIIDQCTTANPVLSLTGGGLTAYRYRLDDEDDYSDALTISEPVMLTGLSEGTHTIYIVAQDQLGNWQTENEAMVFQWVVQVFTLDVDANQSLDALTDGLLIMRYLFGFRGGTALTDNAVDLEQGHRISPETIYTYLNTNKAYLDIDSNGQSDALTDGIVIIRYLMGFTDCLSLMDSAVDPKGSRVDCESIGEYLDGLGY